MKEEISIDMIKEIILKVSASAFEAGFSTAIISNPNSIQSSTVEYLEQLKKQLNN